MTDRRITQWAPWPSDLEMLVAELDYNDTWRWSLHETYDRDYAPNDHARTIAIAGGTTLECIIRHTNSYPPHEVRHTAFTWPVPPTTWNRDSWMMWLLDCIADIERHERGEYFRLIRTIVDEGDHRPCVERPFAPLHGPGDDQNRLHRWAPDDRRRTSFRGEVKS